MTETTMRLSDLFTLPDQIAGLQGLLAAIADRLAVREMLTELIRPALTPGETSDEPDMSEEEALALLSFELDPDALNPPPAGPLPESPLVDVAADFRRLTLTLLPLGEVLAALPGFAGLSFVLADKPLTASVELRDGGPVVSFSAGFAARVGRTMLRPMSLASAPGEPPSYVVDDSRSGVDLPLGDVAVNIAPDGTISLGDTPKLSGQIDQPFAIGATDLVIAKAAYNLDLGAGCLSFTFEVPNLNALLRPLAADFGERSAPSTLTVSLQLLLGATTEMRLEWRLDATPRRFDLPGFQLAVPAGALMTVALRGDESLALLLTLAGDDLAEQTPRPGDVALETTFAWGRDGDRELQRDGSRPPETPPLFAVRLRPRKPVSLLVMDLPLGGGQLRLPTLFRQLPAPLVALADGPACAPIALDLRDIDADNWRAWLTINPAKFQLPFLKNDAIGQLLQLEQPPKPAMGAALLGGVELPPLENIPIDLGAGTVGIPLGLIIGIGSIQLHTKFDLNFNFKTFGIDIDHNQGIELLSDSASFTPVDYRGLTWTFRGAPKDGHYHYFTLATKDYHYEIQQAIGSQIELALGAVSEEPIRLIVEEFAIGARGITLSATVTDDPVRIMGINTKYRFGGSRLVIRENTIAQLVLAGSGPLPPDLVGDATANVSLTFADRDGLTLVDAWATLTTSKPLSCQNTRFEFSISQLGMRFVPAGKFHLYFTLTGSAQFKLAEGDDREGPLAMLPAIKIDLVECPLAGDISVLASHVDFLITLPQPKTFNFLGCFSVELRAIGFRSQADPFDGDAAMQLTGQIRFADGDGDNTNPERDYHSIWIGLPAPGQVFPRLYLDRVAVSLSIPNVFTIEAAVEFFNKPDMQGFAGEGRLEIKGLPMLEAAFSFVRVRRSPGTAFVKAWFIALNAGKFALMIPVVEIYIREIGFGFGYRYTVVALKAADNNPDNRALVKALDQISRTQADLARRDQWALDLEQIDGTPRWTIALRALISQTAASVGTKYLDEAEAELGCLFIFDVVLAFRSNFTFFIAGRGWINTNYNDYLTDNQGTRRRPLVTGYMLLDPPHKRFLARLVSNPKGSFGLRPKLPSFVEQALSGIRFSATLLIEPGLVHYEMGWPDRLIWRAKLGPVAAEYRGGFIFRVAYRAGEREVVIGTSYQLTGELDFRGGVDLGFFGVRVVVYARVSLGATYLGVFSLTRPLQDSLFYGRMNFSIQVRVSIEFWIDLFLFSLEDSIDLELGVTASLELGINGIAASGVGVRGRASMFVSVMGYSAGVEVEFGIATDNVDKVIERTARYFSLGLDSDDAGGEAVPTPDLLAGAQPLALGAAAVAERKLLFLGGGAPTALETPDYTLLLIPDADGAGGHFVIFPSGELEELAGALRRPQGFFPAPPRPGLNVQADMELRLPAGQPEGFALFQLRAAGSPQGEPLRPAADGQITASWTFDWDADFLGTESIVASRSSAHTIATGPRSGAKVQDGKSLRLRDYLGAAFVADGQTLSDPPPFDAESQAAPIDDPRVQNPSEGDYEAAVRGAFSQFRGSPYFKYDERQEYDRVLAAAYSSDTTIYSSDGVLPSDLKGLATTRQRQSVEQLRGLIVRQVVEDLRAYCADPAGFDRGRSLPFLAGLVFRFDGPTPEWMTANVAVERRPSLRQRLGVGAGAPDVGARSLRAFVTQRTSFAAFPPAFARARYYSSSSTIAITWDLVWDHLEPGEVRPAQADPDNHLAFYEVRRRALDTSERDKVSRVKPGMVAHREAEGEGSRLRLLRPRFQIVDEFEGETTEERAGLPAVGRSYLYTITPVDYAGKAGRPLSLVATRYPDAPPQAPGDASLLVRYSLTPADLAEPVGDPAAPALLAPSGLRLRWTEGSPPTSGPHVPAATYRLIMRPAATLPVGSYGLDASTRGRAPQPLPTTSARPLPTDIVIDLGPAPDAELEIDMAMLRSSGVFPRDGRWSPHAWELYIQAAALNGVPSALAPVQLILEAVALDEDGQPRHDDAGLILQEDRRPAELEWLPAQLRLALIPPEDERAITGPAHFPMPLYKGGMRFTGGLEGVAHSRHPAGIRCVRLRWNQGPSGAPALALELNGGYQLLELDIDAHTDATFADRERLAEALRPIQDVQMLPADDLPLVPGDTLAVSRWEAWYPSAVLRRGGGSPAEGDEVQPTPWYSWRDSLLIWPAWEGLTTVSDKDLLRAWRDGREQRRAVARPAEHHPFLEGLLRALGGEAPLFSIPITVGGDLDAGRLPEALSQAFAAKWTKVDDDARVRTVQRGREWTLASAGRRFLLMAAGSGIAVYSPYLVDRQSAPPIVAESLDSALRQTGGNDPYAWRLLQSFGLSATFSLRDAATRAVVPGGEALAALEVALKHAPNLDDDLRRHLYVELLFQAGRSVELERKSAAADALLAIVQVSLRPIFRQYLRYAALTVRRALVDGALDRNVELVIQPPFDDALSLINRDDPAAGQQELPPEGHDQHTPYVLPLRLDERGQAHLLLRYRQLPRLALRIPLADPVVLDGLPGLGTSFTYASDPAAHLLLLAKLDTPDEKVMAQFAAVIGEDASAALFALDPGVIEPLLPTAGAAGDFAVSSARMAALFSAPLDAEVASPPEAKTFPLQFQAMRRYIETLNPPGSFSLRVPTAGEALAEALPDLLAWAERLFEHCGAPAASPAQPDDQGGALSTVGVGPWLATAYPRADTPAYATPDELGRLRYDHLVGDKYAHTFRYFIQPYSRYDQLWQALRATFGGASPLARRVARPDPAAGGLDVVLDRVAPVARPAVIAAGRLDAQAVPGQASPPGRTWEVIIARHPEQVLAERNQTLARRLDFRQIAFSLLRRYAYGRWLASLGIAVEGQYPGFAERVGLIAHSYPDPATPLDEAYPDAPDQLDPELLAADSPELRSIALPLRVPRFQQGVLAVQWEGLPFYYEHRLLIVAQAARRHSPINEVIERNFEYRSPAVAASQSGTARADWRPVLLTLGDPGFKPAAPPLPLVDDVPPPHPISVVEMRGRQLHIPLRALWDSLPESAQRDWIAESIDVPRDAEGRRKPGALPDPEVVYQLVELFSGNIEVQFEIFFDYAHGDPAALPSAATLLLRRRLGERFLAEPPRLLAPAEPGDPFAVAVTVYQISEETLSAQYDLENLPEPTGTKVVLRDEQCDGQPVSAFGIYGVLTAEDRDNLLARIPDGLDSQADREVIQRAFAAWYSQETIAARPNLPLPPTNFPVGLVDFPPFDRCELVWTGALDDAARKGLRALPGDDEFRAAAAEIAGAADAARPLRATAPLGLDQAPSSLPAEAVLTLHPFALSVTLDAASPEERNSLNIPLAAGVYSALVWTGWITRSAHELLTAAITPWYGIAALRSAAEALLGQLATREVSRSLPARPTNADLPPALQGRLNIAPPGLIWVGDAPTAAEQAAIAALPADAAFTTAAAALVGQLLAEIVVSYPAPQPPGTNEPALPEPLSGLSATMRTRVEVRVDAAGRSLAWRGPLPSAAEEAEMRAFSTTPPADAAPGLAIAMGAILDQLSGRRSVALAPLIRPSQAQLDTSFAGRLKLVDGRLIWHGLLADLSERARLLALAANTHYDKEFSAALAAINRELADAPVTVPLELAARSAAAPAELAANLLIGRAAIRYHGLMTVAEGLAIRDLFSAPAERAAIDRLYRASLSKGLRGRELSVRSRRGSALPSPMAPISLTELPTSVVRAPSIEEAGNAANPGEAS